MSFPKVCGCGRVHSELAWALLPPAGVMFADVPEDALSLRNCPSCNSTLAVPVAEDPATAPTLRPEALEASAVDTWFAKADAILAAHLGAELLS